MNAENDHSNKCAIPESSGARGSAAGPNTHTCTTCGHIWQSVDDDTAKGVRKAAQVNGEGPVCDLCMHLEMACRYADARNIRPLDALRQYLYQRIAKPPNAPGEPLPPGQKP